MQNLKTIAINLIEIQIFMSLNVFLMNMCVIVMGLLVRREIKLRKARQ